MSFRVLIAMLAALALSACGAPQAAQAFIRQHTACPVASYADPAWSPDGSLIYYNLFLAPASDLRVVRSDGSDDQLLAHDAVFPKLSPDGTMILFQRLNPAASAGRDVFILDLSSMQIRQLPVIVDDASWSPDSRWIAYELNDSSGSIIKKTDVITGETVVLADGQRAGSLIRSLPVWSPDGQSIAFTSTLDGPSVIYVMSADGSDLTWLTGTDGELCSGGALHAGDVPEDWLLDGESLAYLRWCGGRATLLATTRDGKEIPGWNPITKESMSIEWSPDGTQMLISSYDMGASEVRIARADGADPRLLRAAAAGARWSPDGKQVVFVGVDQAGYQAVFVINADGSGLTQITHNPGAGRVCLH